jgi:hypothetical protein
MMESDGQRTNRLEIGGDVVAHGAVAARRANGEQTVFITQIDRQPINLRLDRPGKGLIGKQLLDTRVENSALRLGNRCCPD